MYAISDIHTDEEPNWKFIKSLPEPDTYAEREGVYPIFLALLRY